MLQESFLHFFSKFLFVNPQFCFLIWNLKSSLQTCVKIRIMDKVYVQEVQLLGL